MSSPSKQTYSVCCFFRRKFKFTEAEAPADIKALFQSYSENGVMTVEHLQKFLNEVQLGQDEKVVTREEAESLMESIIREFKHLHVFRHKVLNIETFFRYLFSDSNSALFSADKVPITSLSSLSLSISVFSFFLLILFSHAFLFRHPPMSFCLFQKNDTLK